jgi:hypothetical protein
MIGRIVDQFFLEKNGFIYTALSGLEPETSGPEPLVLPLHYRAIVK